MPLGADDVQAAGGYDFLVFFIDLRLHFSKGGVPLWRCRD
jgi:hypothetical protein